MCGHACAHPIDSLVCPLVCRSFFVLRHDCTPDECLENDLRFVQDVEARRFCEDLETFLSDPSMTAVLNEAINFPITPEETGDYYPDVDLTITALTAGAPFEPSSCFTGGSATESHDGAHLSTSAKKLIAIQKESI